MGKFWAILILAAVCGHAILRAAEDEVAPPSYQLVISVAEQKLAVVKDGGLVCKYPISTSKFGLGDSFNSYRTPLGHLKVCTKIGDDLPIGSVLKSRNATGEILPANAPGRDPIVTRIMWLEGLEAGNANAKSRGIYIHGTVEESKLGQPVSYGCIRMRSRDVVELFDATPVGAPVEIISEKFPRFQKIEKPTAKSESLIASNDVVTTTVGARGTMVFRTVRGSSSATTNAPATPAAAEITRVAANKAVPAAKAPELAKPIEPPTKLVAKTPPPMPSDGGPIVVFATGRLQAKAAAVPLPKASPAADEPRVLFSMTDSILSSGLIKKPVPAPPVALVPKQTPAILQLVALDLRTVSYSLAGEGKNQVVADDQFTQYLLNPPLPQVRLAFRAPVGKPGL